MQKLGELQDPRTGEAIVKRVFRRDEIYHGPYREEAPDLTPRLVGHQPLFHRAKPSRTFGGTAG